MEFKEIALELKKPFDAKDHKERKLQGGGRWFFIPWQRIKERLDSVCPEWEMTYSDPVVAGELVVIRCRLTIAGICREGVGNSDAYKERTSVGNFKFGSPIECATADGFKNAAEAFGIGAYLDDQEFVVRYLNSKKDGRGELFAHGDQIRANREPTKNKPFGAEPITRNKPPATTPITNNKPPNTPPLQTNPAINNKPPNIPTNPPTTAPTTDTPISPTNGFRERMISTAKQVGIDPAKLATLATQALGRPITKGGDITTDADCTKVCQFLQATKK